MLELYHDYFVINDVDNLGGEGAYVTLLDGADVTGEVEGEVDWKEGEGCRHKEGKRGKGVRNGEGTGEDGQDRAGKSRAWQHSGCKN